MSNDLLNYLILPKTANPAFEQRESGVSHTSYQEECAFYSLVQQGKVEEVRYALQNNIASLVVGNLSDNPTIQAKYWAICCITLGIRYAIQGGIEELFAYNLSDQYIRQVDQMTSAEDILTFLSQSVVALTELVKKQHYSDCPHKIRKCLRYIDKHLHDTIRLQDLANEVNLSEDYLSKLFTKCVGKSVNSYVLEKKLEEARALLSSECEEDKIAYYLGFCSQTYFISCFKKAYGITPHKFAQLNNANKNAITAK